MKLGFKNILFSKNNIIHQITETKKIILFGSLVILLNLIFILPASTLSYQSSELVSFTFNPTIQITISDNLTIPSLSPGDGKDSNIITVTASSNAISGYTLSSTVGDSTTYPTNELRKDGTNTTYKFTNLTSNIDSLTNFSDNEWGYSYSTDSGTTWQSGDITGTPTLGYGGLPLYTTETPITLINSPDASTNSVQFKIGARASTTQVAGEYTNIINFIGLARPNPTYITLDQATYMQDDFSCIATPIGTVKSLIDRRDQQSYLVARAKDGNCWMIENLKLGKTITAENPTLTLTPADSNVDDEYTLNYSDIPADGKFHAYTIDDVPEQNNSNEFICRNDWDSCYYNWFTATAGAGTSYVTTGSVDTDICPIGWSLPTNSQLSGIYNAYPSATQMLVDNPTTTKNNSAGKIPGFLLSGSYYAGGASGLGINSGYWSSVPSNSAGYAYSMKLLVGAVYPTMNNTNKYLGFSVRCLRD